MTFEQTIEKAKGDFQGAKDRLSHAFATTPDDRLNWSPAPTARTPVQLVAHAAGAVQMIHNMLQGNTLEETRSDVADRGFRMWEKKFTTREEVLALLEDHSAAYLNWLDGLTEDQLETMVKLPFNLGHAPLSVALGFEPMHLHDHAGQLVYVQTCYGDQDWHMN